MSASSCAIVDPTRTQVNLYLHVPTSDAYSQHPNPCNLLLRRSHPAAPSRRAANAHANDNANTDVNTNINALVPGRRVRSCRACTGTAGAWAWVWTVDVGRGHGFGMEVSPSAVIVSWFVRDPSLLPHFLYLPVPALAFLFRVLSHPHSPAPSPFPPSQFPPPSSSPSLAATH